MYGGALYVATIVPLVFGTHSYAKRSVACVDSSKEHSPDSILGTHCVPIPRAYSPE